MATGSGKTLIRAGLILYLYEKGYRNFLFFVNSTNIIEKTKDNFLNPRATKYLISENIHIDGIKVAVSETKKFDDYLNNELRILEELHYHSKLDRRYISEITQALRDEGMMDKKEREP